MKTAHPARVYLKGFDGLFFKRHLWAFACERVQELMGSTIHVSDINAGDLNSFIAITFDSIPAVAWFVTQWHIGGER